MVVKVKKKKVRKRDLNNYTASPRRLTDLLAEGIHIHQTGDLMRAESLYDQILSADPDNADALNLKGVIAYQLGNNSEAVECIRKSIQLNPNVSYYHNNLGNALFNMENEDEASHCFQEAIRLMPHNVEAHNNFGNVLRKLGRTDEAMQQYEKAIQIDPGYDAALNNMANLLKKAGKCEEAIAIYKNALKGRPDSAEIHFNLGNALEDAERLEEAIDHYKKAIEIYPEFAGAHNNLGNAYKKINQYVHSDKHYKKAILLQPDFAKAHANLGDLYRKQRNFGDSLKYCRRAVSLDPDFARGYVNAGNTLLDQGCYGEALCEYQKAIDISPDLADAHYNKGLILLLQGKLQRGWEEYEWRFKSREIAKDIGYEENNIPEWDGSRLDGKIILILSEQGMGDHIQFLRYLPLVKERGGRVIFKCRPELIRLFKDYKGIDVLIEESSFNETDIKPEVCIQLLSLPRIFKTTVNTIIGDVPYLKVDRQIVDEWKSVIDFKSLNIGIVWSGSKSHKNDRNRSCTLFDFASLADVSGVRYYGLQKEDTGTGGPELTEGMKIEDLGKRLNDFYDTSAVIMNMDLIITVDTAVAHLAGALGRPVWTLLPFVPDWRWMLDRNNTPWYPTMRLFRQPGHGDWGSVMKEVVSELKKIVSKGVPHE